MDYIIIIIIILNYPSINVVIQKVFTGIYEIHKQIIKSAHDILRIYTINNFFKEFNKEDEIVLRNNIVNI